MDSELEMSIDKNGENDEEKGADEQPRMTEKEQREIFERRFDLFMNQLSERCTEENVRVALAVVVDPEYPSSPLVFKIGHVWDQAKLATQLARMLRKEIDNELTI